MSEYVPWEGLWAGDLLARTQIFLVTRMSMFSSGLRKGHAQGPDYDTLLVKLPQEFKTKKVYSTEARGGDKTTMRPFFRVMVEKGVRQSKFENGQAAQRGVSD
jgi:hypothetical protein